ncbi:MAG: 8-amino-7-oxononanoate synthase [Flavobacteriales bacterium]|nr:8-amino-7-oxononanoate synthase [Flavobacteriales bacterium]
MDTEFYNHIDTRLSEFEKTGMLRMIRDSDYAVPYMQYDGRQFLNFSTNDYLGIANDKTLVDKFLSGVTDFRFGSSGSRLMTGNQTQYHEFETFLEQVYGCPALVYGSGYHANTGILPALTEKKDLILADKLVHASIIDGILSCKAYFQRFRHNDYENLEKILSSERDKYEHVWIVTESIFSMDGDRCDINKLVTLKKKYNCLLYVDEAHSIATDGKNGLGMCFSSGKMNEIDVVVCPMGKALAGHGAIVLCRENVKQYLINTSRTMIFATSLPPICVQWSHFVFREMMGMEKEREHLKKLSKTLHVELEKECVKVFGDSHIVPVILGENESALAVASSLKNDGIWATAIRYPTVPKGQARVRISLSAAFSEDNISHFIHVIKNVL